jgi:hypothetical protein
MKFRSEYRTSPVGGESPRLVEDRRLDGGPAAQRLEEGLVGDEP